MKRTMCVSVLMAFFGSAAAQTPPTAQSKVEQRLADLLAPGAKTTGDALPSTLPPRKPIPSIENPDLPLQSAQLPPPAPPKPQGKSPQPRSAPEDTPLVRTFNQPETPQAINLPVGPLVRLWSPDVNEPLPLPILGAGVRDRASLADPSLDASIAAAQAKLEPARTKPVPFQAQNLPDPFEHSHAVRLRNPPEEASAPPVSLRPLGQR